MLSPYIASVALSPSLRASLIRQGSLVLPAVVEPVEKSPTKTAFERRRAAANRMARVRWNRKVVRMIERGEIKLKPEVVVPDAYAAAR